jgi:hypothetical protein
MSDLSPTTKALLRAARTDGPGASAQAKIWSGVASGTAGVGAVSAASGKAVTAGATAKLFAMGALLGGTVTVGVAAMMLRVGTPRLQPEAANAVHADSELAMIAPPWTPPPPPAVAAAVVAPMAKHAAPRAPHEDTLAHEAALVSEARSAVVRGEPEAALTALQAAHGLHVRALEPEELSLEARALRAMGRDAEAAAVDERLRASFPDHALAQ